jgi:hypothetical protein
MCMHPTPPPPHETRLGCSRGLRGREPKQGVGLGLGSPLELVLTTGIKVPPSDEIPLPPPIASCGCPGYKVGGWVGGSVGGWDGARTQLLLPCVHARFLHLLELHLALRELPQLKPVRGI